ncbi:hypothetical protein C816_00702 [Oscillibacter sp. 1-3]|nr:hypothetical protein C816_00702 [Oscillibacter sp. 1-3]
MPRYIPGTACWGPMPPQCIGAAPPDAQTAGGVCWPVHTGQERDARWTDPRRSHDCRRQYHRRPWQVVSKCALREGRQGERSAQVIPGRSRFDPLLLVDHCLSSLCHSATNEPSANVYLDDETTLYTIHLSKESLTHGFKPMFDRCSKQVTPPFEPAGCIWLKDM